MSDYISALREDLVEAAARQQQQRPAARVARPLHPRNWSPLALAGAATALAAVVVVVLGLRAIQPLPRPTDAQIVTTVRLGGTPRDAVAVGSALVIADYDGRVYRVSPADPRTRTPFDLRGRRAVSLTVAGGAVWVVTEGPDTIPHDGPIPPPDPVLMKVDPGSGRLLARVPVDDVGDAIHAGAVGAWLPAYLLLDDEAARAPRMAVAAQIGNLVVAARTAWTREGDAAVQLDGRGRVLRLVRGIAEPLGYTGDGTILPDAKGAWVLGQGAGVLYRIDGDRVTRRIKVGRSAGVLARTGKDVWATAITGPGEYVMVRIDAGSGRITGRVRLGRSAPRVLAPVGDQLWAVTGGGDALLINPE